MTKLEIEQKQKEHRLKILLERYHKAKKRKNYLSRYDNIDVKFIK